MPRHESVTDDYIAELQAGFEAEAYRVNASPDFAETQLHMVGGTYPFKLALERVEQGWSREEIDKEVRSPSRTKP